MTSRELQQVMARVGGVTHLTAILLQIVRTVICKLVLQLAQSLPNFSRVTRQFRHKCSKSDFLAVYWMTACVHRHVSIDYILGWRILEILLTFSISQ